MRRADRRTIFFVAPVLALLLAPASGTAKNPQRFQAIVVTRFTNAPDVELPPEASDYLYAELLTEVRQSGLAAEVLGEGEVIGEGEVGQTLIITGQFTHFDIGVNLAAALVVGVKLPKPHLELDATILRASDHEILGRVLHIKSSGAIYRDSANEVVKELEKIDSSGASEPDSAANRQFAGGRLRRQYVGGYITAIRPAGFSILDDQVDVSSATIRRSPGGIVLTEWLHSGHGNHGPPLLKPDDLKWGMLVEAKGHWISEHSFKADYVAVVSLWLGEKKIEGEAYFEGNPPDAPNIASGQPARLMVGGYTLNISTTTQRKWNPPAGGSLTGLRVKYTGTPNEDGTIDVRTLELGAPPPAAAFKLPGDFLVTQSTDSDTGTPGLEITEGPTVVNRYKLVTDPAVKDYVSRLGKSLLPAAIPDPLHAFGIQFLIIEDPEINAFALSDGRVFVTTGLLAAVENEAQLAFILSHETAHVLQSHAWRETVSTRPDRAAVTLAEFVEIAAGIGGYAIGTLAAEWTIAGAELSIYGHQRRFEEQADIVGLQNMIEHGYDPREAASFFRIDMERHGDRAGTSVWSDHDSTETRGSWLTDILAWEYPNHSWSGTKLDSAEFQQMKRALGPVDIE